MAFANRYIIEMEGLRHNDFIGQGFLDDLGLEVDESKSDRFKQAFHQVALYTLTFFNAVLKGENQDELSALTDGIVDHPTMVEERYLSGLDKKYDYTELVELVMEPDFDGLFELYTANTDREIPAFSYREFHDIGLQMLYTNYNEQAGKWFDVFKQNYPEAAKAHYLAGVTMRRLKNKSLAIDYLEKAETLLDKDAYLSEKQKELYAGRITRFIDELKMQ